MGRRIYRSTDSFGVAGFLSEDSTILYTSELKVRSLGRVSDLVSAKLNEIPHDELKLRALILLSAFESHAVQSYSMKRDEAPPATLEVGFDNERLAICVSFHWNEGHPPVFNGLQNRVMTEAYQTQFEEILGYLRFYCNQVFLRFEERERKLEVTSIIDRTDRDSRDEFEIKVIDSTTAPLHPVKRYLELGDLEYRELLKPVDTFIQNESKKSDDVDSVEVSPDSFEQHEEEIRKLIETVSDDVVVEAAAKSTDAADDEILAGDEANDESTQLVREKRRAKQPAENQTEEESEDPGVIGDLVRRFSKKDPKKKTGLLNLISSVFSSDGEEEESQDDDVMTIAGGKSGSVTRKKRLKATSSPEEQPSEQALEAPVGKVPNPLEAVHELQDLLEKETLQDATKAFHELQNTIQETEAREKLERLQRNIVAERQAMGTMVRKLQAQIRSKDAETKSFEQKLTEEIRIRDRQLLARAVQLKSIYKELEKVKGTTANNKADTSQSELRLKNAAKLAQVKEEENDKLREKVKELQDKLMIAQAKSRPTNDGQTQAKLIASERKVEEFKRMNQRLTESLQAAKDRTNEKEVFDLKRRVEIAEMQNNDSKRQLEKVQNRVKDMHDIERKYQFELAKIQEENRKLKQALENKAA